VPTALQHIIGRGAWIADPPNMLALSSLSGSNIICVWGEEEHHHRYSTISHLILRVSGVVTKKEKEYGCG